MIPLQELAIQQMESRMAKQASKGASDSPSQGKDVGLMENFMGLFDELFRAARGFRQSYSEAVERIKTEEAAKRSVKTGNFSSELEERVMLRAAEDERTRKAELRQKLASDPELALLFDGFLADWYMTRGRPPGGLGGIRKSEESALDVAVTLLGLSRELGDSLTTLATPSVTSLSTSLEIPEPDVMKLASIHGWKCDSDVQENACKTGRLSFLGLLKRMKTGSNSSTLGEFFDLKNMINGSVKEFLPVQDALDAYEDVRLHERKVSYELLRDELSARPTADLEPNSWQDELGGKVFYEPRLQASANEELLLQLRKSGVKRLYHFTDRQNVQSIVENGGLYSWAFCETFNLVISRPGGSALSRQLDSRKELQRYVRLSFVKDHPMMYSAVTDGRISDPVILEIDLEVVRLPDVRYSDRNAVATGANVGSDLSALRKVQFDLIQRGKWRSEEEKGFYQAEVLIRNAIPGYLIRHEGRLIRTRPTMAADHLNVAPQLKQS
jgi:hypothetical protein